MKKYKKKDFNSEIEYNKFCIEIDSMIDEYMYDSRMSLTISDNKLKHAAARLGSFVEILTDAEIYNTLMVTEDGCTVNSICNARDMIDYYKTIISLRESMSIHFDIYKPNIDYTKIDKDMINEYLLTHKYDSIYLDRWVISMYYGNKIENVLEVIPSGIKIYYMKDNTMMEVTAYKKGMKV